MAAVVVTGGTGTLGRALVPALLARGHRVSVLSRRTAPRLPTGAVARLGDVRTGDGIEAAIEGAGVVIHAASSPRRRARETEECGARSGAAAARRAGAHRVYVSIVGVDHHRFPYYRAKYAAEQIVARSGVDWTVLRATQFHELIDSALGRGVFIRTRHMRFQPVDVGEVAARLGSSSSPANPRRGWRRTSVAPRLSASGSSPTPAARSPVVVPVSCPCPCSAARWPTTTPATT
jgi:uncharacterized protein YbjT (DUF2867 family)